MSRLARIHAAIAAAMCVLSPAVPAQEPPGQRLADHVPAAEVPLYLTIREPGKLFAQEFRNPVFLNALKNIPTVGPQLENPQLDQAKAVLGALAATEDMSWLDMVQELLAGPAELAIAGPNKLALSVRPKDPARLERLHSKLLEFAEGDATQKGNPSPVNRFEHAGQKCFSLAPTEFHTILDGRFLLTGSEQSLKDAIDAFRGHKKTEAPLAADAGYTAAHEAAKPETREAWAFVNLEKLRTMNGGLYVPEEYNPLMALLFGGWVEAYNKAGWTGLALSWKDAKPSLEATMPISAETAAGPIRTAFAPPPGSYAERPLTVPNQIGTLSLWRDLGKVWNVRDKVVAGPAQQGLDGLDNGIGQFFGGRDFETGVLGALKPDWRLVVAEQNVAALNPKPDLVLPSFAICVGYDTKDEDFRQRWVIAFQSFVGVLNVVGAQEKAPAMVQNQEQYKGASIFSAAFLPPAKATDVKNDADKPAEGVHIRHNFRPTLTIAGDKIVVSSTVEMARAVVDSLTSAPVSDTPPDSAFLEIDGQKLGKIVETNKERLVMQNMVEKGNGRKAAETEIGSLEALVRGLNHATATASDTKDRFTLKLSFDLNQAK
ncbi:hypothetical protein GC170_07550 [bacterium]|nr:hypothetical protein [bacterium]